MEGNHSHYGSASDRFFNMGSKQTSLHFNQWLYRVLILTSANTFMRGLGQRCELSYIQLNISWSSVHPCLSRPSWPCMLLHIHTDFPRDHGLILFHHHLCPVNADLICEFITGESLIVSPPLSGLCMSVCVFLSLQHGFHLLVWSHGAPLISLKPAPYFI